MFEGEDLLANLGRRLSSERENETSLRAIAEEPGDNGAGLLTISVGQEGEIRAESSIAKDVSST